MPECYFLILHKRGSGLTGLNFWSKNCLFWLLLEIQNVIQVTKVLIRSATCSKECCMENIALLLFKCSPTKMLYVLYIYMSGIVCSQ